MGMGIVSTGGWRRDEAPRGAPRGMASRGGGGEAPFAMNDGVPRCARCARRRRGVSRRRSLPSSFVESRRWRRRFAAGLCVGWERVWVRVRVRVRGRLALALRPGKIILWQLRLPWPVSSAELCVRRLISSARRGLRAVTPGSRLPSLRRTSGLAPVGRSSHGGDGVASPSPLASASEASSSASRSHSCWALSAEDVTSIEDMFKCVALDLVSVATGYVSTRSSQGLILTSRLAPETDRQTQKTRIQHHNSRTHTELPQGKHTPQIGGSVYLYTRLFR